MRNPQLSEVLTQVIMALSPLTYSERDAVLCELLDARSHWFTRKSVVETLYCRILPQDKQR